MYSMHLLGRGVVEGGLLCFVQASSIFEPRLHNGAEGANEKVMNQDM